MISARNIIEIVLSLVILAVALPIALIYIVDIGNFTMLVNGVNVTLSDVINPAVLTLLTVVLPIVIAIVIMLSYLPSKMTSGGLFYDNRTACHIRV